MVLARYNNEWKTVAGGTCYADTPVGTIQAYGGTTLPAGWLLCNGAELLISAYPELYDVIGDAFGTASDTDHFVLPDLRGEFLRGAGTNSHADQGSGGNVGEHQDATSVTPWDVESTRLVSVYPYTKNSDGSRSYSDGTRQYVSRTNDYVTSTNTYLNVRPTNTSVNFIIKAKKVAIPADFNAHVEEVVSNNVGLNTDSTPQEIMIVGGSATVPNGITSQGQTWTATDNGYIYFEFRLLTLTQVSISLDGVMVHSNFATATNMTTEGNGEIHSAFIRIKKGQTVKLWLAYTGGNKAWLYQAKFYKD